MQLGADTATKPDTLIGAVRFFTGTDSVEFPADEIKPLLNQAYHQATIWILEVMDKITFQSDKDASINLVNGTANYTFPSDILTIRRVEINYTGNSQDWSPVDILTIQQYQQAYANIDSNHSYHTTKTPALIVKSNTEFLIDPVPTANVSNGIHIWFTKVATELSNTTDEPVIVENFHPLISVEASLKYAVKNSLSNKNDLKVLRDEMKADLQMFYSNRDKTKIRPILKGKKYYYE